MEREVINQIHQVRVVRGIPGVNDGEIITINLYHDKITINDTQFISLERVKEATTFKLKQMMLNNQSFRNKSMLNWLLPKRLIVLICLMLNKKTLTFLSLEYINEQGLECKGLLISDNYKHLSGFAKDINRQKVLMVKRGNQA